MREGGRAEGRECVSGKCKELRVCLGAEGEVQKGQDG